MRHKDGLMEGFYTDNGLKKVCVYLSPSHLLLQVNGVFDKLDMNS